MKIIVFFIITTCLFSVAASAQSLYETEPASHFQLLGTRQEAQKDSNNFANRLAILCAQQLYPDVDWADADWFRNTKAGSYFQYKVTYQDAHADHVLTIDFESYSDGLEWKFWANNVSRYNNNKDREAHKKEFKPLIMRFGKKVAKTTANFDCFKLEKWIFMTAQSSTTLKIPDNTRPEKLTGVWYKGKLHTK